MKTREPGAYPPPPPEEFLDPPLGREFDPWTVQDYVFFFTKL